MTYTKTILVSILTLSVVSWSVLPVATRADNDDHDDDDKDVRISISASAKAKAKVNSNGKICKIAAPGHLIAPGFLKKNEKPTLPACQILPPGIMKRLIDMEKKLKKDKKPDVIAPFILQVRVDAVSDTSARIRWDTHEKSTTQVAYGTTASYGSLSPFMSELKKEHSVTLTGLSTSTTYHFRVQSADAAGNLAQSADFTFMTKPTPPQPPADTTAPSLSFVSAFMATSNSAIVFWQTDERADGQVSYGTSASYGQSTALEDDLSRVHVFILTGLSASTEYHFQARSRDAAGNLSTSTDATFTTGPAPADTTAPVISNVEAKAIMETSAKIAWGTDEAADSQVEYGTTASYGSSTTLDASRVTAHEQSLTGLTTDTTYHYRVKSRDAAGNLATSADATFKTSADSTAAVIANVTVSATTQSTALISWTTNEVTDARVYFSKSTPVNLATSASISSSTLLSAHALQLYGLEANTTYYFVVESKDGHGNVSKSTEFSFRTLP